MSFQEAMELMLKTTTIDDMELVVIIAPGRKAGAEGYGAGGNNTNYRG